MNKKESNCSSCCVSYKNKKLAEKCEAWCKSYDSCNMKSICSHPEKWRKDENSKSR